MKKKILTSLIAILVLCICVFTLTACGGNNDNNGGGESVVAVTSVTLNRSSVNLEIGDTVSLYETIYPSNATDKSVTWSSSNTSVATVSNGTVTAKSSGTATITAKTSNNKTATCYITVNPQTIAVTSVTLNKTSVTIEVGDTLSLSATISPSNATDKSVTWSSSNTSVATVSNGTVTAKSSGTATITAKTSNNKTATCLVKIEEKSPFVFEEYVNGYALTKYTGMDSIVTVPANYNGKPVISIGMGDYATAAFRDNTAIKKVILPSTIYFINAAAFQYCRLLESIEIPNSVESIGDYAFFYCTALTSVVIPNSVTSIGGAAFRCCSSLTSVEIPNSVTSIGDRAFEDCTALTSIEIPNSVESIGDYAFSWCALLYSVVIPNSVTSIGDYAFSNCTSLTIYCEAESKPSGWKSKWNYNNRPIVWDYKNNSSNDDSGNEQNEITISTPNCPLTINEWEYRYNNYFQYVKTKVQTAKLDSISCSFQKWTSSSTYLIIKITGEITWDIQTAANVFIMDYRFIDENGYAIESGVLGTEAACCVGDKFIITYKILLDNSEIANYGKVWELQLTDDVRV